MNITAKSEKLVLCSKPIISFAIVLFSFTTFGQPTPILYDTPQIGTSLFEKAAGMPGKIYTTRISKSDTLVLEGETKDTFLIGKKQLLNASDKSLIIDAVFINRMRGGLRFNEGSDVVLDMDEAKLLIAFDYKRRKENYFFRSRSRHLKLDVMSERPYIRMGYNVWPNGEMRIWWESDVLKLIVSMKKVMKVV